MHKFGQFWANPSTNTDSMIFVVGMGGRGCSQKNYETARQA